MATAELGINITARNQARGVLRSIQDDVKGLRGALGDVAKFTAGNLLASGITSGINAITSGAKMAVGAIASMANEAADFNAQISSIGAVAGASGAELAQLKQLALDLGVDPRLKVSAVEAAQAIEMLARNGLKVPDIMNGAAEATVLLANATGADFATAADIGTDVMALWGIEADNMMTAVNGITSVVNNSKFSINDYRLALAQGGGVASAVGVSFDDFNTAIAATASLFGSGSDAGTSMKTLLQRLVPQTDKASAAMSELGLFTFNTDAALATLAQHGIKPASTDMNTLITALGGVYENMTGVSIATDKGIKDFNEWISETGLMQNAFFDANGQMKDMASIAGILNTAMNGLSEEQKILTLSTIFGTDAMRAAVGLAGYTEEEFRKLYETMAKTDAVESAAARMDNLAGDMEIFRSVVESVRIQIGDKFDPVLRAVFQSGSQLVAQFAPSVIAFAGEMANALDGAIARLANAKQQFDFLASGGNVIGGLLAGLGTATGGEVTVPIGAEIVNVEWTSGLLEGATFTYDAAAQILNVDWVNSLTGDTTFIYDALAQVTSVDWTGGVLAGAHAFTYGAEAKVLSVDWESDVPNVRNGYTYSAEAGITAVNWQSEQGFSFTYDASAGVTEVDFGIYTGKYTGTVSITDVLWGIFYGRYEANAGVTDVAWGAYTHTYQPDAEVTMVAWGLWTYTYSTKAAINSVLWGAFTNSYTATAQIQNVGWGAYTHTYDSQTRIGQDSVLWGAYTHTYDARAEVGEQSILWGAFTYTYDANANISSITTSIDDWTMDIVANISEWTGSGIGVDGLVAPDWNAYIEQLEWPSITWSGWDDFVTDLQWPSITWPGWSDFVDKLKWPSISWPGWSSFVPKFSWPSVPSIPADWWKSLNPFGGGGSDSGSGTNNATSTGGTPAPSNGNRGRGGFAPGNGFAGFGGDAMSDPLQAVSIIMAEFRLVGNEWIAKSNEMIQELTDNTSALRLLSDVQLLSTELSQSALSKNSSALASAADLIRLSARGLADAVGRTGELLANSGGSNDISISPTPIPVSSFPAGGFFGNQTALTGAGAINVTVNVENVGSNVDVEALAYRVAQAIQRRR